MYNSNEEFKFRKVTIKEFKIKKKRTKIKEIDFDEHNHHIYTLGKFHLISCLI